MFQTLHFQQRIKRIILIYHAARRCIPLMPQAATNGIEWLHSAFVFIRCTFRCIVHCINSSYSKYSLLKKASETSVLHIQHTFRRLYRMSDFFRTTCLDIRRLPPTERCGPLLPDGQQRMSHQTIQTLCQAPLQLPYHS